MPSRDLKWMRYTLAIIWLVTGALSLGIYPQQESLKLLARVGLSGNLGVVVLYGSAMLDVMLGVLTLLRPSRWLWKSQAVLIVSYSIIIAIFLPEYWLHPFGPLLKNLPILMLLWLLYEHEERRS